MDYYRMEPKRRSTKLHSPINSKPPDSGSIDHAYCQLAVTIVTQAILDWCHSYDQLRKNTDNREARELKRSSEKFFNSSEPEYLCGIKGTDIYDRILKAKVYGGKNEIENYFNKQYVSYMPPPKAS